MHFFSLLENPMTLHCFGVAVDNETTPVPRQMLSRARSCLSSGAKQLYESLATKDKFIKIFPDADHFFYHALFVKITPKHEPAKRKQVTAEVKNWLKTH